MVDAAIGGKTAVDTPFGKNLIGTTYHPQAVVVDLAIVDTLSAKQRISGLAEILKLGLVYNADLFTTSNTAALVIPAIEGKLEICTKDPMDLGIRRILNFGHTIAHGLEAASDYEISHGHAVLIGCLVESHLSMRLGYLPEKTFATIEALYRTLPLQLPKQYQRARFLEAMAHDKKAKGGKSRFVLIDQIGHAIDFDGQYCQVVDKDTLMPTLEWMETTCTS
jgi:3-dehydroquinate synthase